MVAFGRRRAGRTLPIRGGRGGARQAGSRATGHRELVAVEGRLLPHMIDDQDLVRQIQHQVALIIRARQAQLDRLELEHQIVAERAIEPEMLVFGTGEEVAERPQYRKHAGLAAALLLREAGVAGADRAVDAAVAGVADLCRREAIQMVGDRPKQQLPPRVQRLDPKAAAARRQHQRRIDKPHVPARVAAGKLEARREQHAAPLVELLGQRRISRAVGLRQGLALDMDAALGFVADALHGECPPG